MSRKQIRHRPNLRYTARGRPHSRQRRRMRILSRGRSFVLAGSRLWSSSSLSWRWNSTYLASVDIGVLLGFAEWHAERPQELTGLVVALGAGDEGDVHALGERRLVGVDLREHQLLGQAQAVIALP